MGLWHTVVSPCHYDNPLVVSNASLKILYGKEMLLDIYAYTPIGVVCIKHLSILM
jgi:hypothetical protein